MSAVMKIINGDLLFCCKNLSFYHHHLSLLFCSCLAHSQLPHQFEEAGKTSLTILKLVRVHLPSLLFQTYKQLVSIRDTCTSYFIEKLLYGLQYLFIFSSYNTLMIICIPITVIGNLGLDF